MIEVAAAGVVSAGASLLAPTTLEVDRGEIVALRGANGSGKTTLLRLVGGKIAPTTGHVRVAGEPVDDRSAAFRARVAGSLGHPPFARDLTVREHLTLVGATWGRDVGTARADAAEILAELGLSTLADRFAHELSSGQTQLAALAIVLSRPFEVLLLDEPEQRLDADHLDTVIRVLERARDAGATVLLATHSDRLADSVADRIVTLADAA
jgi:ABC-2 type transport system ATP-binding protein